uniref:Uncharacterized protein n=1 Tax=Magallana gigas TaxID=29159 RepID=A0A8W8N524_MAGGI
MKGLCLFAACLLLSASNCFAASLTRSGCAGQVFNCFVNPCSVSQCSYPGSHCIADYCGGCNAVWYDGHTKLSAQQCSTATT